MPSSALLALQAMPEHFDELLHLPTLIILACFFRNRWVPALMHLPRTWKIVMPLILRTALSACITVFLYLLFAYFPIKSFLPLPVGLAITTAILFATRWIPQWSKVPAYGTAAILGLAQSIALFPGISRMGITYAAGCLSGLSRRHAFESSCAIHVPLILASIARGSVELASSSFLSELLNLQFWVVILVASIIAYGGLWVTWKQVLLNRWDRFGWYVAVLTLIVLGGGLWGASKAFAVS